MKTLKITLSDDVFGELKNFHVVKGLCGSLYGVADEFMHQVIKAIEKGDEEISLELKKKKKSKKRKGKNENNR